VGSNGGVSGGAINPNERLIAIVIVNPNVLCLAAKPILTIVTIVSIVGGKVLNDGGGQLNLTSRQDVWPRYDQSSNSIDLPNLVGLTSGLMELIKS